MPRSRLTCAFQTDQHLDSTQVAVIPDMLVHRPELEGGQSTVACQLSPTSWRARQNMSTERDLSADTFNGTYCSACGRLSRRIFWGFIGCDCCGEGYELALKILRAEDLSERYAVPRQRNVVRFGLGERTLRDDNDWRVVAYDMPDGAGVVYHAQRIGQKRDADALFEAYQREIGAKGFKRHRMVHSKGTPDIARMRQV